jgi:integrase
MRKPFFKASHGAWYCNLDDGSQVKLGRDEADAWAKWVELRQGKPLGLTLGKLAEKYLAWCERNNSAATLASYKRMIDRWTKHHGGLSVLEVKPHHLDEIVQKEFSACVKTTHWQFYKVAQVLLNWAEGQGLIESHSLKKLKNRPQCAIRQDYIKRDDFDKLIAACDDLPLRDLLTVLWESGARPFEVMQAESRHLDRANRCLQFARKQGDKVKAKKDKEDATRTVYLSEPAFEICNRLADLYPTGPLFRNSVDKKWTANLLSARFKVLKNRCKFSVKLTAYVLRHSFCTRAILGGVDVRTLQELMGHSDLVMISKVYSHLKKETGHLHGALGKLAG